MVFSFICFLLFIFSNPFMLIPGNYAFCFWELCQVSDFWFSILDIDFLSRISDLGFASRFSDFLHFFQIFKLVLINAIWVSVFFNAVWCKRSGLPSSNFYFRNKNNRLFIFRCIAIFRFYYLKSVTIRRTNNNTYLKNNHEPH